MVSTLLSHSHTWSCLVLDLKELLPILDRYVISCIIASHATLYTDLTHDQALFPLLKALAHLVSVGNLKHKPEALFTLFRQFLTRISLPRLIHFLDLVLPQLMPVQAAWAGEEKTLVSCHHIRWLREKQSAATPRVQISYFFSSHDNVHHVRIQWNSNPLLLFSDPIMVEALPVEHFRQQASHMTHQQHLQMGLRKGMAILIYYVVGKTHYQAVLIAEESVMNRGGKGENRLWKRVTPSVTEFAWLPPNIAESFCKNALYRVTERTYCAFDTPHLGLDTENFVADVFVENILYLGDTRSADDLAVFTKMVSSSQSSARTPMRRAATLEKTWKMSNRNGRIRSIISSNTRRMSLALLALIWIEPFLALTLTTLQHFRQLKTQKLYMHVDGRPRKVRTVSRGEPCLMYETRLSRMIMQLPPAQMANRDGDAGMETMLWDINIIPNELDNGYLMLPPRVLHMSALGRFGRFTLFSPRVSHSKHLPVFRFVLCFGFGGVCCFVVFLFPVLQVFGIPNSPRSLDLDDRQGFIASSAMQQKKKKRCSQKWSLRGYA